MKKYFIFISVLLLVALLNLNLFPDEGDQCIEQERKFISTFTNSVTDRCMVLYGQEGATSQLDRGKDFKKYHPRNAFDNDMSTAWVEGSPGNGVGEILAFYADKIPVKIGIVPGYGLKKYFKLNNRIKSALLSIYTADRTANQCMGLYYRQGKLIKAMTVEFNDVMEKQYFNTDGIKDGDSGYIITLEIKSVYPGSKYDDTCIAEISVE